MTSTDLDGGDVRLVVRGRPALPPGGGATPSPDALPLLRGRIELSGWDTTFSDAPGPRQELFALLEADVRPDGDDALAAVRVAATEPGAVHRHLPALGLAVQDTLARFGVTEVHEVAADLPAAGPDPQSLPYLHAARSWFGACPPGAARTATLTCRAADADTDAEADTDVVRAGLTALARRHLAPFAVDPGSSTLVLPEPTVTAATWAIAAVAAALRVQDVTGAVRLTLRCP